MFPLFLLTLEAVTQASHMPVNWGKAQKFFTLYPLGRIQYTQLCLASGGGEEGTDKPRQQTTRAAI